MRRDQEENAGNMMNEKQKKTKHSMTKNSNDAANKGFVELVKTYITHNKGGKWELIKAPAQDSEGVSLECYIEDDCSLHL